MLGFVNYVLTCVGFWIYATSANAKLKRQTANTAALDGWEKNVRQTIGTVQALFLFPKISEQEMGEMGDSEYHCLVHRFHFVTYYANPIQGTTE